MSLTRKLLKELELNDQAIERIIAAHADTVDALTRQRDEARQIANDHEALLSERDVLQAQSASQQEALAACQQEYQAYREQVQLHLHRENRRNALTTALRRFGANEQAIPLMLDAIRLEEDAWQDDALKDEGKVLNAIKEKYGSMFKTRSPIPTVRCTPPLTVGGALTHEDLRRMTPADINRNWDAVSAALTR